MNKAYVFGALALFALIHFLARALPFLVLDGKKLPAWMARLSDSLPAAIMMILVVYALRGTDLTQAPYGLAEALAVIATAVSYYWKENTVLSLVLGTGVYVILLLIL